MSYLNQNIHIDRTPRTPYKTYKKYQQRINDKNYPHAHMDHINQITKTEKLLAKYNIHTRRDYQYIQDENIKDRPMHHSCIQTILKYIDEEWHPETIAHILKRHEHDIRTLMKIFNRQKIHYRKWYLIKINTSTPIRTFHSKQEAEAWKAHHINKNKQKYYHITNHDDAIRKLRKPIGGKRPVPI